MNEKIEKMIAEPVEFPPFIEINIIYESEMRCKLFVLFAGLTIVESEPHNLDEALTTAREEIVKYFQQLMPKSIGHKDAVRATDAESYVGRVK
jgi:hypothetical protein